MLVYFWALYSTPLIYVSLFMPISYYFDYDSFVISLEVRVYDASSFILLSQNCFGYLGVLWFSMNFRTVCSCCSVAKSCLTLCDPMDCSMLGFCVLHYLLEFAQTYVRWINGAIQPSHPLSSPSPPTPQSFPASGSFPRSQFLISGGQSIWVSVSTSVSPMNIQDEFF